MNKIYTHGEETETQLKDKDSYCDWGLILSGRIKNGELGFCEVQKWESDRFIRVEI